MEAPGPFSHFRSHRLRRFCSDDVATLRPRATTTWEIGRNSVYRKRGANLLPLWPKNLMLIKALFTHFISVFISKQMSCVEIIGILSEKARSTRCAFANKPFCLSGGPSLTLMGTGSHVRVAFPSHLGSRTQHASPRPWKRV